MSLDAQNGTDCG